MKRLLLMALCVSSLTFADTHYVDFNNSSPTAPYTNWNTAAQFINPALSAAIDGDIIFIADGQYLEPEIIERMNRILSEMSVPSVHYPYSGQSETD